MTKSELAGLKNIGKTVEKRLSEIGIRSRPDLEKIGAAKAYEMLSAQHHGMHLPVCYYLYSLQGALQDKHWDEYSEQQKKALRLAAGMTK